ncbi:MAG TPA: methyltransferase domain-containing protein [Verrucomicrobiae bacterium]|nr:methyltransferase domain-containing protein [Verrucomicrobiae bacterium]
MLASRARLSELDGRSNFASFKAVEQDPSKQDFWDRRYEAGKTPWDSHGVPGQVKSYIADAQPGRILIPGCGSGYEVAAFHAAGWSVTAIDFSSVAVERAKNLLGPLGDCVVLGDFFRYPFGESVFDVVYERTFLCALPPRLWPDYASRMRQLIRPGGKLIGFFLYGDEPEPPPYPMAESQAMELFGCEFTRTQDIPLTDSLPVFAGKERWQEWKLGEARRRQALT